MSRPSNIVAFKKAARLPRKGPPPVSVGLRHDREKL